MTNALRTDRWLLLVADLFAGVRTRAQKRPAGFAALRLAAGHIEAIDPAHLSARLGELMLQDWHTVHVLAPAYSDTVWGPLSSFPRGAGSPELRLSCLTERSTGLTAQRQQALHDERAAQWLQHLDEPDFAVMDHWLGNGRKALPAVAGHFLTPDWIARYYAAFDVWSATLQARFDDEDLDVFAQPLAESRMWVWVAQPEAVPWTVPDRQEGEASLTTDAELEEVQAASLYGSASAMPEDVFLNVYFQDDCLIQWPLGEGQIKLSATLNVDADPAQITMRIWAPSSALLPESVAHLRLLTSKSEFVEPCFEFWWTNEDASIGNFALLDDPDGNLWHRLRQVVFVGLTIDPSPSDGN